MESRRTDRWHRYWDKKSRSYDREMGFWDRHVFGDSRAWPAAGPEAMCSKLRSAPV
ncbi:hypothetical protein [Nocardia africana]|uniref:Uncharacterized protein n=1 Tax=Nocardia africana TaxID=134964 RepID=A0A378X364_9NOCA|nr:hypothetical protein [Nocardia africana]SUA47457.1 Uncharacterised protein [Nocardia africana]